MSTRQLLQAITESAQDIVSRYPIRNPKWNFDRVNGAFVAERSELGIQVKDPWLRPIETNAIIPLESDGEVYAWNVTTTVEGEEVQLTIFND